MKIDKLKFFVDSANIQDINKVCEFLPVHGVTTNPSLAVKCISDSNSGHSEKFAEYKKILAKICDEVAGDVSGEVVSNNYEDMKREAFELVEISKNIVVKLPITRDGLRLCKFLSYEHNVSVNMTLCFSASQALLCAMNGAKYVSPFIGRLDDLGVNGMDLIREIKEIFLNYSFQTQILAASVRNASHFTEVAMIGVDAVTAPLSVYESLYKNALTDKGLEIFANDWNSKK